MPDNQISTNYRPAFDITAKPETGGAVRDGGPGITLVIAEQHDVIEAGLRAGKHDQFALAVKKTCGLDLPGTGRFSKNDDFAIYWCGPNTWHFTADSQRDGALLKQLSQPFSGLVSLCDQGHGRETITVSGPDSRKLLAKATQVDLHPRAFRPGACAVTQMAHVAVHLALLDNDSFQLSLYRSFADDFLDWLLEMALEFGYQMRTGQDKLA